MAKRVSRRSLLKATGATAAIAAAGGLAELLTRDEGHTVVQLPFVIPTAAPLVNEQVDGYVAVAPKVLRPGQTEAVSVSCVTAPKNGVYVSGASPRYSPRQ